MLEGFVAFPQSFVRRYIEKGYWVDKTPGEEFDELLGKYSGRVALAYNTGIIFPTVRWKRR